MEWLVPVRRAEFAKADGWSRLRQLVEQEARSTSLVAIREAAQVLFRHDTGRTVAGGLQINTEAFSQLCALLSGGLYRSLGQIFSLSEKPPAERQLGVLRAYNSLMSVSFDRVKGHRFVIDGRSDCVVGVVGPKYQFVPNHHLVQESNPWVTGVIKPEYTLLSAKLRNRDLRVILVRRGEARADQGVRYAQGVALFNSETTRRAVFLPQLLFDDETKSFSMEVETKANRLIHRKRNGFGAILSDVIRNSVAHDLQLSDWVQRVRILRRTPIGRVHASAQIAASVERRLVAKDLGAGPINCVLRLLSETSGDSVPSRWQLYRALVMTADRFGESERVLRQMAYGILEKANARVES